MIKFQHQQKAQKSPGDPEKSEVYTQTIATSHVKFYLSCTSQHIQRAKPKEPSYLEHHTKRHRWWCRFRMFPPWRWCSWACRASSSGDSGSRPAPGSGTDCRLPTCCRDPAPDGQLSHRKGSWPPQCRRAGSLTAQIWGGKLHMCQGRLGSLKRSGRQSVRELILKTSDVVRRATGSLHLEQEQSGVEEVLPLPTMWLQHKRKYGPLQSTLPFSLELHGTFSSRLLRKEGALPDASFLA